MPSDSRRIQLPRKVPRKFIQESNPTKSLQSSRRCKISNSLWKPPVLVIRSTCDYKAQTPSQLSFQAGEFFHVADIHTDSDGCPWYLAENPPKALRGLVPSHCFQKFAPRRARHICPIKPSVEEFPRPPLLNSLINGYLISEPYQLRGDSGSGSQVSFEDLTFIAPMPSAFRTRFLYGVVRYRFSAERQDELSAEPGEPVVIIAHSAQEWFVVKPIGQLGGPGLIPASYVEVRDMNSGRIMGDEDVQELIRSSAIPQVQQWKEIVTAYKSSSIDVGEKSPEVERTRMTSNPQITVSGQEELNNLPVVEIKKAEDPQESSPSEIETISIVRENPTTTTTTPQRLQSRFNSPYPENICLPTVEEEEEDDYAVAEKLRTRYGSLYFAHVTSFHYEQEKFWFEVRLRFRKPDDKTQSASGFLLYRLYEHFQELDSSLRYELGSDEKLPPKLSESVERVDELVCAKRIDEINQYLEHLCELPDHIRGGESVFEFISQKAGDVEMEEEDWDLEWEGAEQVDVFEFVSKLPTPPSLRVNPSEDILFEHVLQSGGPPFVDEDKAKELDHQKNWVADNLALTQCLRGGNRLNSRGFLKSLCLDIVEEFNETETFMEDRI